MQLHVSYGLISFPVVCLSKLASCPCVEHAHQTSSTLPVWHMHARHVQWHPHNKLATERINFLVHYSTDVCFNVFLRGTPSFPTKKKQTLASGNCSQSHIRIFKDTKPLAKEFTFDPFTTLTAHKKNPYNLFKPQTLSYVPRMFTLSKPQCVNQC